MVNYGFDGEFIMLLKKIMRTFIIIVTSLSCIENKAGCEEKQECENPVIAEHLKHIMEKSVPLSSQSWKTQSSNYSEPDFVPRKSGILIAPRIKRLDALSNDASESYKFTINQNMTSGAIGRSTEAHYIVANLRHNNDYKYYRTYTNNSSATQSNNDGQLFDFLKEIFFTLHKFHVQCTGTAALEYPVPEPYSFHALESLMLPKTVMYIRALEMRPRMSKSIKK